MLFVLNRLLLAERGETNVCSQLTHLNGGPPRRIRASWSTRELKQKGSARRGSLTSRALRGLATHS